MPVSVLSLGLGIGLNLTLYTGIARQNETRGSYCAKPPTSIDKPSSTVNSPQPVIEANIMLELITQMKAIDRPALTRRERQIMDVLYRLGRATAAEVMNRLSGDPHDSTVRTQLRVLETKGYVRHEEEKLRYVYTPAVGQSEVRRTALEQLIDTFYDGSTENVVAALLGFEGSRLSQKKLDRIAAIVEQARKGVKR